MSFNQSDKLKKAKPGRGREQDSAPVAMDFASAQGSRLRLQQQPARVESDRQQQQSSGSGEFQPHRRTRPVQLGSSAGPSSRQQ